VSVSASKISSDMPHVVFVAGEPLVEGTRVLVRRHDYQDLIESEGSQ